MPAVKHPPSTPKESLLRLLWKLSGRRRAVDTLFTTLLKHRQCLQMVDPRICIPRFEESEVRISRCPLGTWSTPLIDVFVIIKAAIGFGSKRILELGSYRGDTARLIAQNTPDDVRIVTVDIHSDHGVAYKDTPLARRIERKIGKISPELFAGDEPYDFIFVDADHDFASVFNDTTVAFQLLSERGVIFWHDYGFAGYFHGMAGVPETLRIFSAQHPIVSLNGTLLALHSRHPGWETSAILRQQPGATGSGDVWKDTRTRG